MAEQDQYMYSAFISYRHIEPDQSIAKRIQHSIETFAIPAVYQKTVGKKHFSKVFRDSDELSLDRDLAAGIDYALSQSEFLICILSREYKESPWCLHEIEEFLKTHDRKNVLCVLAEGEPREVLPEILTHVPSKKDPSKVVIREPLCADYRLDKTMAERFELPRLLSSMLHCSYDDLMKRQSVYRRNRYIRILAGGLAILALIIALQMRNLLELSQSYEETLYSQSQTLATQSLQHLSAFDRERALELALLALPSDDLSVSKVTAEAVHAITKSTYAYQPKSFAQIRSREMQNEIVDYAITSNQKMILTLDSSAWILAQTVSGEQVSYWQIDGDDQYNFGFIMQDDSTVLGYRGNNLYSYDYAGYGRNWAVSIADDLPDNVITFIALAGDSACSVVTSGRITVVDLADGQTRASLNADAVSAAAADQIRSGDGSDDSPESFDPSFVFMRQWTDESGRIFFSGRISYTVQNREADDLCIGAWDPNTNALKVRVYDLPSYCLQLQCVSPGSLIAVAADTSFSIVSANRLLTEMSPNEFGYLRILCMDSETLDLMWTYDLESMQAVTIPRIDYIAPDNVSPDPLVSLTFDVDTYIFDLNKGSIYCSATLPDSIILVPSVERAVSQFYCSNHKSYSLYPSYKFLSEDEGLVPFPDSVQAAEIVGNEILAFCKEYIYWFGPIHDRNNIGKFELDTMRYTLETEDAGNGLLALHTYDKLFILDLKNQEISRTFTLNNVEDLNNGASWSFLGALPDEKGFLMISKDNKHGTVRLHSYDNEANLFVELHTFSKKTNFGENSDWSSSVVYNNGIVYMVSADKENTLLFYNAMTGVSGEIPVTGIPDNMKLAESYNDYVHEQTLHIPRLTISANGQKLFTTLFDPEDASVSDALIDLDTGKCTVLESLGQESIRSRSAAFSEDGSKLACSSDYSILIYKNNYAEHSKISTRGLNVRSMVWFKDDLWVEYTSDMVERFSADGELISQIELDYRSSNAFDPTPKWTTVPISDNKEGLMLTDGGNMNLLSEDYAATTPVLYVPNFTGWDNDSDTFLVLSSEISAVNEENGLPYLYFYTYPRYSKDDLIRIGTQQIEAMQEEDEEETPQ